MMIDEEMKSIEIDGAIYRTRLTAQYEKRKEWIEIDPGKVYAYIPGTIIDIKVKEGDKVKKGDVIMLLEAMKMRNKVMSPTNGTIKMINVALNQVVAKNVLLIEIQQDSFSLS